MKARALAAQVGAHMAYRDKQLADAGLVTVKTREEQAFADAQDAAARAGPAALNAAVPAPAIVEAPRADAPGTTGYGPQPGIVTPEAQRMHDAQIAANNALWPIIVRSGANPVQLIEGIGKGEGLSALSGGLVPGSKPDPNVQRVAGGLYTGSAPTTSTVWSPGDIAGQQAEAGKDIAVARAKPPEPKMFGDQPYTVQLGPDGQPLLTPTPGFQPAPKAPERQVINDVIYERNAQGGWSVAPGSPAPLPKAPERQVVDGVVYERQPNGAWAPAQGIAAPAPDKQETQTIDGVVYAVERDPQTRKIIGMTPVQGAPGPKQEIQTINDTPYAVERDPRTNRIVRLTPVEGVAPKPPAPAYSSKTDKADALNRIVAIQQKLASGQPLTPQEADLYESDYNQAYGPTRTRTVDPGTGKPLAYSTYPSVPANVPSINDVRKAAGLPPRAETPQQDDEFTPRVTPEQDKARSFANSAAQAETHLTSMTPKDIPNTMQAWLVTQNDPGLLMTAAQNDQDEKTKLWAQTMWQFTNAINRKESGAAITNEEWATARKQYIPMPRDGPALLKQKYEARIQKIRDFANEGFRSDPKAREAFDKDWTTKGAGLDGKAYGGGGGPDSDPVPPEAAAAGLASAWPHMDVGLRERTLKKLRGQ